MSKYDAFLDLSIDDPTAFSLALLSAARELRGAELGLKPAELAFDGDERARSEVNKSSLRPVQSVFDGADDFSIPAHLARVSTEWDQKGTATMFRGTRLPGHTGSFESDKIHVTPQVDTASAYAAGLTNGATGIGRLLKRHEIGFVSAFEVPLHEKTYRNFQYENSVNDPLQTSTTTLQDLKMSMQKLSQIAPTEFYLSKNDKASDALQQWGQLADKKAHYEVLLDAQQTPSATYLHHKNGLIKVDVNNPKWDRVLARVQEALLRDFYEIKPLESALQSLTRFAGPAEIEQVTTSSSKKASLKKKQIVEQVVQWVTQEKDQRMHAPWEASSMKAISLSGSAYLDTHPYIAQGRRVGSAMQASEVMKPDAIRSLEAIVQCILVDDFANAQKLMAILKPDSKANSVESDQKAQLENLTKHVLVRVQDDLHGAFMGKGGLTMPYLHDRDRNSIHFTVNCIVEDHAYGKFNFDNQGQFKAKIVLLTDLKAMPVPAGLGQVDTWYRLDSKKNKTTGKIDRSLALGSATIVAPVGTMIPAGAKAIFYDGGIEARDAAVKEYFDSRDIKMEVPGMRCWSGYKESESVNWSKDTGKSLFSTFDESRVHTDLHSCSVDSNLESLGTQALLAGLKTQRLSYENGIDTLYIDEIEKKSVDSIQTIKEFLNTLPAAEHQRIGLHYESQIAGLQANLEQARAIDCQWLDAQTKANTAVIAKELQALPGGGNFFLAKKDNQAYESLDIGTFAAQLVVGSVSLVQKVWRAGMTLDWTSIRDTAIGNIMTSDGVSTPMDATKASGDISKLSQSNPVVKLEPIRRNGYPQPDRAVIEEMVANAVEQNPASFIKAYINDERSLGGRYVAADLFKETFPEYRASKESRNRYNNPLHNSAAVLSAEMFRQRLANTDEPQQDTVLFLTGIPGAGKTSSVLAGGQLPEHVRCVFEGQMSNPVTTFEKIQQVLDAGLKPVIIAVHARPEDALQNTFRRFKEHGRGASINVMANIQGGLPSCLAAVYARFGDQVTLQVNDYCDRKNPVVLEGWAHLSVLESEGSHEQIKSRLSSALQLYAATGIISNECLRQASGQPPIDIDPGNEELEHDSAGQYATDVG